MSEARKGEVNSADEPSLARSLQYRERIPEQDALLTLLFQVGETLARSDYPSQAPRLEAERATPLHHPSEIPSASSVAELIGVIAQRIAHHPELAQLLEELPAAFQDGRPLMLLFRNLYPNQTTYRVKKAQGTDLLTPKQIELLEIGGLDVPNERLAQMLGIDVTTVKTHWRDIYKELGVHNRQSARFAAVAKGYLSVDTLLYEEKAARHYESGYSAFQSFCADIGLMNAPQTGESYKQLGAFALLLLAISGAARRIAYGDHDIKPMQGALVEIAQGKVKRVHSIPGMGVVRGIAIAPTRAAKQGFTPGNLFLAHDHKPQQELNRGAISEFTPAGEYLRTFCGSSEIESRLIGPLSLCFNYDGSLLATAGNYTHAILAFSENGAKVRPFALGIFVQLALAPNRRLFGVQHSPMQDTFCFLTPEGNLERMISGPRADGRYFHLAVSPAGTLYIFWEINSTKEFLKVSKENQVTATFVIPGYDSGQFALDAQDRLVSPCCLSRDVKIADANGNIEQSIPLASIGIPRAIAVGNDGTIWVGVQTEPV